MQNGHLRKHAVSRLMNNDAARSVEHGIRNDDPAANRQAMHEPAIVCGVVEPRFVDAPIEEIIAEGLVAEHVTVMRGRGP
jgi:hypothetical protein